MKRLSACLCFLVIVACKSSKKEENTLPQRLKEFMAANDEMNFDKVLDYTYPKLFQFVPRETLKKTMGDVFDNPIFTIKMDSFHIDKLNPVFKIGNNSYAKVAYSMVMIVQLKKISDTASSDRSGSNLAMYTESFSEKYGAENVSTDESTQTIKIRTTSPMVAIKDESSKNWTFANLSEDNQLTNKLFSKELLDSLANYK